MPEATQLHTARRFTGLNLFVPPEDIAPGELTVCDNLRVVGGELVARPGKVGQLTTAFGNPLYAPFAFLTGTGGTQTGTTVLCSSNGRLYQWVKGATTAGEISIAGVSGSIVSSSCQMTRLGGFAYIVDGTNALMRTNLTTGVTLTGMSAPTTASTATLTSTLLDGAASTWTPDTLNPGTLVNRLPANQDFSDTNGSAQYTTLAWNPDFNDSAVTGASIQVAGVTTTIGANWTNRWLLLDHPGEGVITTAALNNDTVTNDSSRYATEFYVAATFVQGDTAALCSQIISISGYDGSGTFIGKIGHEFKVPYPGSLNPVTLDAVISFAGQSSQVVTYKVSFEGGAHNTPGTGYEIYMTQPVVIPIMPALTVTSANGYENVRQPNALTDTGGFKYTSTWITRSAPGTVAQGTGIASMRLVRDFGANISWVASSKIYMMLTGVAQAPQGLQLKLALRASGSSTRYVTNPFTISTDGTVASLDISTLNNQSTTILGAFRYAELIISADFTAPSANGDLLFGYAGVQSAGNLSVGFANYQYIVTEVNANPTGGGADLTFANVIESNGAPPTVALTTSITQAQTILTLPAAVNGGTTHYNVYRFGGAFSDGIGRLLCTVDIAANNIYRYDTGLMTWNYTTKILTDDVPDSFLFGDFVDYTTGRDAPPSGAQAVCAWQGRLCLAVGGKLWISWLIQQDGQAALYFTKANSPTDPLAAVKGAFFSVGQDDNDPIVALVPMGTNAFFTKGYLIIVKQHSIWLLSGTDPSNFALQSFLIGTGVGAVAPRSACLVNGKCWYLSAAGVREFDGDQTSDVSQPIEPLLHPVSGTLQTPSAVALSAMVYHDKRLHVFAPVPGGSANSVAYVFDTRTNSWTRDLNMNMTGACSLSSQTDNGDLIMTGLDGQIYLMTNGTYADKATPSAGATPIAWAVKTRGMGQEGDDLSYWKNNVALRTYVSVNLGETVNGTVTVDSETTNLFSQTYTLAGYMNVLLALPPSAVANFHIAGLSGSSSTATRIKSLAVESVEAVVVE